MLRVLSQHKSASISVALCMLDIDHFKTFNDNHGHQAGDDVLNNVAAVLRNTVGNKGMCYRYGGEELCAILPNYTRAEAEPLAERIRAGIENSPVGALPKVTVSLGVALTETAGYDVTALLKAADDALYAAKRQGRNRVILAAAIAEP
jgi:diguanylate cyclase (GGDEF)-like protein